MSINLKKLREFVSTLDHLPENTSVVMGGFDHSFRKITTACVVDAECDSRGRLAEWHGEEHAAQGTHAVKVIYIG